MTKRFNLWNRLDWILQLEGLILLGTALVVYRHVFPGRWGLFALLFLLPDLVLLGYLLPSRQLAAALYNLAHSYVLPLMLGLTGWSRHVFLLEQLALIWIAHIALDRMLGFGLKSTRSFKTTHIQLASAPHADDLPLLRG